MATTPTEETATGDDLRASYGAIVSYHNNLVHMRFTVAGLFIAANGFLASGFFQTTSSTLPWFDPPVLGIVLAILCWLIELRTYQLLENLEYRGLSLEAKLRIETQYGFFSLMRSQKIGPRLLVFRKRFPTNKFIRYVVSHSFGLGLLYGIVTIFWMSALLAH
ncbi:MAG: hypothetical protein PHI06_15290 [Desulfobulbaceae bacterium]|nr:hypothetical protein [Desulfobulbaceae bacterium]